MKVDIVIGAGFGDEGKGRTVDWLCDNDSNTLVVRFNGGAQAGHTVVRNGKRHVFHHFGSGALAGVPTYLSRHFILNPMLYVSELKALQDLGAETEMFADENCLVTTPWDMLYNQAQENARETSTGRHGSCGVGINTTIMRSNYASIQFMECDDASFLRRRCEDIQNYYVAKAEQENVVLQDFFHSPEMQDDFVAHTLLVWENLKPLSYRKLSGYETLVMEGAQGLLLDQGNREWFPHVTHSNTGSKNPIEILYEGAFYRDADIDVYYVTRSYLTRHGAGPLPGEDSNLFYEDTTNVRHPYQGVMRFAPLNIDLLAETCLRDMYEIKSSVYGSRTNVKTNLVVTCMDQTRGRFDVYRHSRRIEATNDGLVDMLDKIGVWDNIIVSDAVEGEMKFHKRSC